MSERAKELRAARVSIHKQMQDVLGEAAKDPSGLTGERKQKYDAMRGDFTAKTDELRAQEEIDRDAAELAAPQAVTVGGENRAQTGETEVRDDKSAIQAEEKRSRAFVAYLKNGMADLDKDERQLVRERHVQLAGREGRDLSGSSSAGSAGGFTVPQGFLQKITERMKYYGPMRQLATVIETESGQDLPWPTNDDTSVVGAPLGENVVISEADAVFGQNKLKAGIWTSGLVKASTILLNDSAFDVESWLAKKFGQRLGRGQNAGFTNGASNITQGLLAGLAAGANQHNTGTVAGGLTYSYTDIVNLKHAVDVAYRTQGVWMMNDSSMAAIQLLVDSQGRPLFFPAGSFGSVSEAAPDTILGQPAYINNDLPVPAASASGTIVYGDLADAYIIRDVLGVQTVRLDERYADALQVGFFAFQRTDAMVDDSYAAAYLVNHS